MGYGNGMYGGGLGYGGGMYGGLGYGSGMYGGLGLSGYGRGLGYGGYGGGLGYGGYGALGLGVDGSAYGGTWGGWYAAPFMPGMYPPGGPYPTPQTANFFL